MDLIELLTAALDAEELSARTAIEHSHTSRRMIDGQMVEVPIRPSRWRQSAWPPERVLDKVAADREILELHNPASYPHPELMVCPTCVSNRLGRPDKSPCLTLRTLAKGYGIDTSGSARISAIVEQEGMEY